MLSLKMLVLGLIPLLAGVYVAEKNLGGWYVVGVGALGTACVIVMCVTCHIEPDKPGEGDEDEEED